MKNARLHVINPDEVATSVLFRLLAPTGIESRHYPCAEDFLNQYQANGPACLLVDMLLPDWGPLRLLGELKRRQIHHPCIFMSYRCEEQTLMELLEQQAFAFIKKPLNQVKLTELIQVAMGQDQKQFPLQQRVMQLADDLEKLGKNERRVVDLVVKGLSAREIAATLQVSPRTVENQRLKAYAKLGVATTVEMVRRYTERESYHALT
ncbi:two component transcriptional regulator, LuxR family [Magnetococcus marinus MC-1]|uniref:Two component transcriptional regulator, LuxR family n=1 Tax=Magnetococcus marinus (strain ATCC BAA-1437 / JCM 17883 / MC-1) TaxID=156889 RepID=A0LD32_MAGMM|nr:response regulator [Magnetococcus marinus]ABK45875.1 two component transcriptional regulator, LuxR family [Magnetococcus marinus MC-1]